MLQKCSNKQSTTSMESEVFEKKLKKKNPNEELLAISHIPILTSPVTLKMHTKSTVGAL